jgi:hypothetical protein
MPIPGFLDYLFDKSASHARDTDELACWVRLLDRMKTELKADLPVALEMGAGMVLRLASSQQVQLVESTYEVPEQNYEVPISVPNNPRGKLPDQHAFKL